MPTFKKNQDFKSMTQLSFKNMPKIEEHTKPKASRMKHIIQTRAETQEIENKNKRKFKQRKADSFKRPLARLTKQKGEEIPITIIRSERGHYKNKKDYREYYEQLNANKLDEMEEFLEKDKLENDIQKTQAI